jgi:hypothetical protein
MQLGVTKQNAVYRQPDFDVPLTVYLSTTLVNNQIDAQNSFKYLYYNPLHVSSNILLFLKRSNCINTASGIVTLSKWPSGAQIEKEQDIVRNM